jgi:hypothetical protein
MPEPKYRLTVGSKYSALPMIEEINPEPGEYHLVVTILDSTTQISRDGPGGSRMLKNFLIHNQSHGKSPGEAPPANRNNYSSNLLADLKDCELEHLSAEIKVDVNDIMEIRDLEKTYRHGKAPAAEKPQNL